MNESISTEGERHYCPECQAGVLQITHVTYFTSVFGEMITVPDFPAWVCDICRHQEYDERALSWLYVLLDPNTARPVRQANRPHPPVDGASSTTISK
jgi:YgiT-type zinc finger domain-containing protein